LVPIDRQSPTRCKLPNGDQFCSCCRTAYPGRPSSKETSISDFLDPSPVLHFLPKPRIAQCSREAVLRSLLHPSRCLFFHTWKQYPAHAPRSRCSRTFLSRETRRLQCGNIAPV